MKRTIMLIVTPLMLTACSNGVEEYFSNSSASNYNYSNPPSAANANVRRPTEYRSDNAAMNVDTTASAGAAEAVSVTPTPPANVTPVPVPATQAPIMAPPTVSQ